MKYLKLEPVNLLKYEKYFKSDLSKFIHSCFLLPEDLGKNSKIDGINWKIIGLWDVHGYLFQRDILLRSEYGQYAIADSRVVALGMGYQNVRNPVTGKEKTPYKPVFSKLSEIPVFSDEDDSPNVWERLDSEIPNIENED